MKKTLYQCDCCGRYGENPMFTVSFNDEGHDLCDECFGRMRGWLWSHEGVKLDRPMCLTISQDNRGSEKQKFYIQSDPVSWKEHLMMSPYGMQELLLKFCGLQTPDDKEGRQ